MDKKFLKIVAAGVAVYIITRYLDRQATGGSIMVTSPTAQRQPEKEETAWWGQWQEKWKNW